MEGERPWAGKVTPAKLLELLERAGAEALRAGGIVHRLRDFVQRGSTRREPADLRELVRNATRWLVREMDQDHMVLRLELGEHALPILADRIQIEQVFVNILQNSIDAIRETGACGEVDVQAGRGVDGMAEVRVHDTGKGLAADAVDRLFEPYFTPPRQAGSEWVWRSAAPSPRRITGNSLWSRVPAGPALQCACNCRWRVDDG